MLANVSRDSVHVYLKLFSFTDANQPRLVRSKMSNIFKPNIRQALNQSTSGSSQGIFGGESNVFKNMLQTWEGRQDLWHKFEPRRLQPGGPWARVRKTLGKKPDKAAKTNSTDS